jgi:hypothetical protein
MGFCKVGRIGQRLLIRNSGNQEKSRERLTMKIMKEGTASPFLSWLARPVLRIRYG